MELLHHLGLDVWVVAPLERLGDVGDARQGRLGGLAAALPGMGGGLQSISPKWLTGRVWVAVIQIMRALAFLDQFISGDTAKIKHVICNTLFYVDKYPILKMYTKLKPISCTINDFTG